MGSVSGWLKARCKECGKVEDWYMSDAWPFSDAEIVGTCDDCYHRNKTV